MTVFLDTGVIVAWINTGDQLHERAKDFMTRALSGAFGAPIVIDHVIDESFTLLMSRARRADWARSLATQLFAQTRPLWQVRATSIEDLREAADVHVRYFDRKLSLTDSALIIHASQLRGSIATFDTGFQGIVPITTP